MQFTQQIFSRKHMTGNSDFQSDHMDSTKQQFPTVNYNAALSSLLPIPQYSYYYRTAAATMSMSKPESTNILAQMTQTSFGP